MISRKEIIDQLNSSLAERDFSFTSSKLVEDWKTAGIGSESIEPILSFMRENPRLDYGSPGPLVHFLESFYGKDVGYESSLIASVESKPTFTTIWMLKRLTNGTKDQKIANRITSILAKLKDLDS